jgi:DNA-directed RNA polymerase subunit H (RpoH/RPB5)
MDTELLDLIARTRPTILEILRDRGYATTAYENASPVDLQKLATTNTNLLTIRVERDKESGSGPTVCNVLYWVESTVRHKVENEMQKILFTEGEQTVDPLKEEFIILLSEPFHEAFHLHAIKFWNRMKARFAFFHMKHLVTNPRRHVYVPAHRKLSEEELVEVMKRHHIRAKGEFPRIIFHVDMQARVLGLVPGDVVEIKRPSTTCGEYTNYRVCAM